MTDKFSPFPLAEQVNITESNASVAEKVASSPGRREPVRKPGAATSNDPHGPQESESDPMPYDYDSLHVLSKRDLIALLHLRPVQFDTADRAILRDQTMARLKLLQARAREGKSTEEASEFARWILTAGVTKLFEGEDALALEKLRKDVLWTCSDTWSNTGQGPWVAQSELEAANRKLDNLANLVQAPGSPGPRTSPTGGITPANTTGNRTTPTQPHRSL
jgi:hypothetical protein